MYPNSERNIIPIAPQELIRLKTDILTPDNCFIQISSECNCEKWTFKVKSSINDEEFLNSLFSTSPEWFHVDNSKISFRISPDTNHSLPLSSIIFLLKVTHISLQSDLPEPVIFRVIATFASIISTRITIPLTLQSPLLQVFTALREYSNTGDYEKIRISIQEIKNSSETIKTIAIASFSDIQKKRILSFNPEIFFHCFRRGKDGIGFYHEILKDFRTKEQKIDSRHALSGLGMRKSWFILSEIPLFTEKDPIIRWVLTFRMSWEDDWKNNAEGELIENYWRSYSILVLRFLVSSVIESPPTIFTSRPKVFRSWVDSCLYGELLQNYMKIHKELLQQIDVSKKLTFPWLGTYPELFQFTKGVLIQKQFREGKKSYEKDQTDKQKTQRYKLVRRKKKKFFVSLIKAYQPFLVRSILIGKPTGKISRKKLQEAIQISVENKLGVLIFDLIDPSDIQ